MVEEPIIRGMTKGNISRSCRVLRIELERASRRANQRVHGLANKWKTEERSLGWNPCFDSRLCSQSFHYDHCHERTLLPSYTQKTDRQLPINTWRQYYFHLGLIVYQRLDCPDFRTLNVNVLPLVDGTGLAPSLAASIDKIVLQSQYLLSIFQLRYATSHSGTT